MSPTDVLTILKDIVLLDCGNDDDNIKYRLKLFSTLIKTHWQSVAIDVLVHSIIQFDPTESVEDSKVKVTELVPSVFKSFCSECHEPMTACQLKRQHSSSDHFCWNCLLGSNITTFFTERSFLLQPNQTSILLANVSELNLGSLTPRDRVGVSRVNTALSQGKSTTVLAQTAETQMCNSNNLSAHLLMEGIPASHLLAHQQNILEPVSGTRFAQSSDGHKVIVSSSSLKWTINAGKEKTPVVVLKQSGTGVHPQDKSIELAWGDESHNE